MRSRLLFLSGVCLFLSISSAYSSEEVYVDLSVLNTLQSSDSPMFNTSPLFPDGSLAPKPKKIIKKKTVSKPAKALEAKNPEIKAEIVVPAQPEPKSEMVVPAQPEPKSEIIVSEPVSSVSVEKVEIPVKANIEQNKPVIVPDISREDVATVEPVQNIPTGPIDNSLPVKSENINSSISDTPVENNPIPAPVNQNNITSSTTDLNSVPVKPLIKQDKAIDVSGATPLFFADDSAELSEENKQKIDASVKSFEDAQKNKILILAYNFDDGQDVFKKKRQSLNRAIEIRSYLLNQGYKNFSIKVVNVTDDNTKRNLVEINEIK